MTSISLASAHAEMDVPRSLAMWRLWVFLSWQDIKQRYRGSLLGPFWTAGSIAALTLGAGSLHAIILKVPYQEFLPYLVLSITVWTLISGTLLEASGAFLGAANVIKNTSLPLTMQIFRTVSRNVIVLAHNIIVVVALFAILQRPVAPTAPLALLGLVIVLLNLVWMSWIVAALSARFRDVVQIVSYGLTLALFMTPIFWQPGMVGHDNPALRFNPFWHLIEVVRAPILGGGPSADNWFWAGGGAIVGLIAAYFVQRRFKNDVVFWV